MTPSAHSNFIVNVKNTFIELSLRRRERKRRSSCPAHWKVSEQVEQEDASDAGDSPCDPTPKPEFASGRLRKESISSMSTVSSMPTATRPRFDSQRSCSSLASTDSGGDVSSVIGAVAVDNAKKRWWTGRVWPLAQDKLGCRELQAALQRMACDDDELKFIVREFQGRVNEASRCPHANYVLQKCILMSQPSFLQFVVDELTRKGSRSVAMLARHKYGCRIVQRLLERCSREQTELLTRHLLDADPLGTCAHPYGNYAMQHVYEHSTPRERRRLVDAIVKSENRTVNDHQCAVMTKILSVGSREDKEILAKVLAKMPRFATDAPQSESGQLVLRLARRVLQKC